MGSKTYRPSNMPCLGMGEVRIKKNGVVVVGARFDLGMHSEW